MQLNAGEYLKYLMQIDKQIKIIRFKYDAWFMLGSAAFRSEKWETAIRAFRFCTNLDPDVNLILENFSFYVIIDVSFF